MKYSFVVAALIGLISFEQVQQVKASQEIVNTNEQINDSTLIDVTQDEENAQEEQSEEGDDEDEDVQVNQDDDEVEAQDDQEGQSDEEHDDDTLIYEGSRINEDDDQDEQDEDHQSDDDKDVQLEENEQLQEGQFESLDESEVNENEAIEMEQLNFEYRPHSIETIGLNDEDEEEDEADEQEDVEDVPDDVENVQLQDDYFTPTMDGHAGLGTAVYERVIPARFANDGDSFMSSMIQNYALEGKNEDGTPNGKFTLNESITKTAAMEVLKTHKKMEGKDAEEYMKQYFDRTWAHFDVTKDGQLDVDVMPQFMRFFASDQSLDLS